MGRFASHACLTIVETFGAFLRISVKSGGMFRKSQVQNQTHEFVSLPTCLRILCEKVTHLRRNPLLPYYETPPPRLKEHVANYDLYDGSPCHFLRKLSDILSILPWVSICKNSFSGWGDEWIFHPPPEKKPQKSLVDRHPCILDTCNYVLTRVITYMYYLQIVYWFSSYSVSGPFE